MLKDISEPILESMNIAFYGERFVGVIKLEVFERRLYSGLPSRALNAITSVLKKKEGETDRDIDREIETQRLI